MRILLSTDTVGGVWDYSVTLARGLHDAGCEVLLAVIGEPRDERLAALPTGVQVASRTYRLEWMPDAAADVDAAGEWLRDLAKLWRADVVHLNQMAYATREFPCPVLTCVHSDVLSWHAEAEGRLPPAGRWDRYERWVRAGLAASDVVVAPTRYQADLTERLLGRAVDRVIPNGVAVPTDAPSEKEVPSEMILTVGRAWDEAKGVHVLDRAIKRMDAPVPIIHLLGETCSPDGELRMPRHLQVHGRVERAEVDAWMSRAGIYVAPSLYEPFGLAPLEAALRGCALVLSDIGSFRELWDGCAAFFPRGDADALATVIAELRADPRRRARLAASARRRALRRYTASHMVTGYTALYREMVTARGIVSSPAESRTAPRASRSARAARGVVAGG